MVLSGSAEGVEKAIKLAKESGAKRALPLPVSAPFHSPLMQPAADVMAQALDALNLNTPNVPVVCNVTAQGEANPQNLKQNLITQVTGSVRWRESMIWAADQGVEQVVELGTGKVLTGLAKRCDSRLSAIPLNTPKDIDNWLESLSKQQVA